MDTIVFFIRSFNDIDHMTPIIDFICKEKKQKVRIFYNRSTYDFEGNHNIQYLKHNYGLSVDPLWGGAKSTFLELTMCHIIDSIESIHVLWKKNFPHLFFIKVMLVKFLYRNLPSWKKRFFDEVKPAVVVFDLCEPSLPHNRVIVKEANRRHIPTICVPHGLIIYTNKYVTHKTKLTSGNKELHFDCYLYAGEQRQFLVDRGVINESIIELGSSRYCREWMSIYNNKIIKDRFKYREGSEKLKVVLFLSQSIYNVNDKEVEKTIQILASMPDIDFVIKPHTRGMTIEYIETLTQGSKTCICEDVSSVAICNWADVGIVYGSSIALQVLYAGKLLIYPDYIDTNSALFSEIDASCVVCSVEELKNEIFNVLKNINYRPYTKDGVKELFSRIVYAGEYERDVRRDIVDYMLKYSQENFLISSAINTKG